MARGYGLYDTNALKLIGNCFRAWYVVNFVNVPHVFEINVYLMGSMYVYYVKLLNWAVCMFYLPNVFLLHALMVSEKNVFKSLFLFVFLPYFLLYIF